MIITRLLPKFMPGFMLLALVAQAGSAADAPTAPQRPRATDGAAGGLAPPPPGMFAPPGRAITHVKGDVYRASNGGWYVAILDTPEGLLREVEAAMRAGLSLEQMKQSIRLEPYQDWRHYEQLRVPNIEAAYLNLKTSR